MIRVTRITRVGSSSPQSALAHDQASLCALTYDQAAQEIRVARDIVDEHLRKVGLDPGKCRIIVTTSAKFSKRMGDARCTHWSKTEPAGRIRLSRGPLWRRASPAERRQTVIHELAHILADAFANRHTRHGPEWKAMMRQLGAEPDRCHLVGREGLRRQRTPGLVVDEGARVGDFVPGCPVTFTTGRRGTFTGVVVGYGSRRVTVEVQGRTWHVHPSMLRKVPPC